MKLKVSVLVTIITLLFLPNTNASISPCKIAEDQLLKGLQEKNKPENLTKPQQTAEWEKLPWLLSHFGKFKTRTYALYKLYLWKDYGAIVLSGENGVNVPNGEVIEAMGKGDIERDPLRPLTIKQLISKLGPPDKTLSDVLFTYTWTCEHDQISAAAGEDGIVIQFNFSGDAGSQVFGVAIPTKLALELSKVAQPAMNNALEGVHQKMIESYNNYFKTSFKSPEEIDKDIIERGKLYYQNLRECKKGAYEYPSPYPAGFLFKIASISGQENNNCIVNILYQMGTSIIKNECQFPMNQINVFNDKAAENLNTMPMSGNETAQNEAQKLEWNACRIYVDGKEIPKR